MEVDDVRKVGVLGCGLMGSGIAQVAATAEYPTVVVEIVDSVLKKECPASKSRSANLSRKEH
jgi:3-hydroxybutyryl-CoA dehydrogenase